MQFARVNGVVMHHQWIGAAEGKPVIVFANSLGTDFRIWRDVVVRLAGEMAILAYDKRGHGLSDIGTIPYSMDDHVDDLAALLDHLALKKAIICGLSVGGMIAQGLAARRPDLVRALVLCDTGHKIGTPQMWQARIAAIREGGIAALADAILERWFTPQFRDPGNAEFAGYRNMLLRQPADGYVGTCQAIAETDYTQATSRLRLPVTCMVGDQDGSTPPELVRELANLIHGAGYDVIAGSGHLPCIEQPDAVANIIRGFVQRLSANGKSDA